MSKMSKVRTGNPGSTVGLESAGSAPVPHRERQHPSQGNGPAIVVTTALSHVDGQAGRLIVRGWPLEDLARHTFEETADHLWSDLWPCQIELWPSLRERAAARLRLTEGPTAGPNGARDGTPAAGRTEEAERLARDAVRNLLSEMRIALEHAPESPDDLVATLAVCLAVSRQPSSHAAEPRGAETHHGGLPGRSELPEHSGRPQRSGPPHARGTASQAYDVLSRRNPTAPPTPAAVAALNAYWATVAEHGVNASTFTARVVASTGARLNSCISAALCALEGPLHGGAPGPVLDMLDSLAALKTSGQRRDWLANEIREGRRLMGFGHRIYQVRDPRAEVLKRACETLAGDHQRLAFAQAVEGEAREVLADLKPHRSLDTNVEFYTAILLDALGFDREEFTAVFACGRVLGWLAHVAEQRREGRLIRPESRYVGPLPA